MHIVIYFSCSYSSLSRSPLIIIIFFCVCGVRYPSNIPLIFKIIKKSIIVSFLLLLFLFFCPFSCTGRAGPSRFTDHLQGIGTRQLLWRDFLIGGHSPYVNTFFFNKFFFKCLYILFFFCLKTMKSQVRPAFRPSKIVCCWNWARKTVKPC